MRCSDIEKINKITTAINGAVPNLDYDIKESETEITINIILPKAAPRGRPVKIINLSDKGEQNEEA